MVYSAVHTQQVLDQLWVRHKWFRVCVDGVSAVLNLSQCFEIAQQYITQPLGIHTWDLPLLSLLIFKPNGSEERYQQDDHIRKTILHKPIWLNSTNIQS